MTVTFIAINNSTSKFRIKTIYIVLPLLFTLTASFGNWLDIPYWSKLAVKSAFMIISFSVLGLYTYRNFEGAKHVKELFAKYKK